MATVILTLHNSAGEIGRDAIEVDELATATLGDLMDASIEATLWQLSHGDTIRVEIEE